MLDTLPFNAMATKSSFASEVHGPMAQRGRPSHLPLELVVHACGTSGEQRRSWVVQMFF